MVKFKVLNEKKEKCSYEFPSIEEVLTSWWVKKKEGPKLPSSNSILTEFVVDDNEYLLNKNTKFSVAITELSILYFTNIHLIKLLGEFNSKIVMGEPTPESVSIKGSEIVTMTNAICEFAVKASIPNINITDIIRFKERIKNIDSSLEYYIRWDWDDDIGNILTYVVK